MTNPLPISVGYNKVAAVVMLVSALFILGVAVFTGNLFPQALTGGILVLVALGYLTQPALIVSRTQVELKNLLGMTMKRLPFQSLAELTIRGGSLWVGEQKVGAPRWMLDGADFARLAATLAATKS